MKGGVRARHDSVLTATHSTPLPSAEKQGHPLPQHLSCELQKRRLRLGESPVGGRHGFEGGGTTPRQAPDLRHWLAAAPSTPPRRDHHGHGEVRAKIGSAGRGWHWAKSPGGRVWIQATLPLAVAEAGLGAQTRGCSNEIGDHWSNAPPHAISCHWHCQTLVSLFVARPSPPSPHPPVNARCPHTKFTH